VAAIEKGLEPLARLIFDQKGIDPEKEALHFLNDEVKDVKEALQGAGDIIAEWILKMKKQGTSSGSYFQKLLCCTQRWLTAGKKTKKPRNTGIILTIKNV
jgi:uncharacterized protein